MMPGQAKNVAEVTLRPLPSSNEFLDWLAKALKDPTPYYALLQSCTFVQADEA